MQDGSGRKIMNRDRARELLPIIQAFAEGKDIQWQFDDEPYKATWRILLNEELSTERPDVIFRIKPEPEVIYVNSADGDRYFHATKTKAIEATAGCENLYEYIAKKFIEVTE